VNFNSPLPRATQPFHHEGSELRSVRDSDSNSKLWQKAAIGQRQNNQYGEAIERITRELGRLRRRVVGGGAVSESGSVVVVTIKEYGVHGADYILCTNQQTGEDVYVLKPYLLRASMSSRTVDGVAETYTYISESEREAAAAGYATNLQKIDPTYEVGDELPCLKMSESKSVRKYAPWETIVDFDVDDDGTEMIDCEYLEVGGSRVWAYIFKPGF
jgi:hypothetical protein